MTRPTPTSVFFLLLAAAGTAFFVRLGFWQLDRAEEKRALFDRIESAGEAEPVSLDRVLEGRRPEWRPVVVRGRYVDKQQFLLDGMTHQGRAGAHVMSPFRTRGGRWLLVDRGWIESAHGPVEPDSVAPPRGERTLRGRLARFPEPGLRLGRSGAGSGPWPRRVSFPTLAELEAALEQDLVPWRLLLSPDEPGAFVREWRPDVMPPQRHVGYAVQWFALAATVMIVYGVLVVRSRRGRREDG